MTKKQSPDLLSLPGARHAALPRAAKPCLATLVDDAPAGDDWLHEVKFDGYRILAWIEGKRVRLISRNGLDWTPRFKTIAGELAKLKVESALVDGEVVAVNSKGVSDFGALQDTLSTSGATAGLLKCVHREEFVIVGYTDPAGTRQRFGSLILGYYDGAGMLHPAGKVGTGFDEKTLRALRRRLDALPQVPRPFKTLPITIVARTAHWVEPRLVAEVRYSEWTGDGSLRHPAFLGLREDKAAREVIREEIGRGVG